MGDILPCPFCGESLTQRGEGLNYRHPENDCIFGSWVFTSDQIPTWNKRADLVPQWQPIETAPRNSKARLVWCPENQCTYCVSWRDTPGNVFVGWVIFGGEWRAGLQMATHWMPLPSPPEAV